MSSPEFSERAAFEELIDEGIELIVPNVEDTEPFSTPTPEQVAELQEWCSMPHVALPIDPVDVSDGTICPLTPDQLQELREHIASEHVKKSNLCKGRLLSEGPRRMHRRIRDVDRATHCLHIDLQALFLNQ